LANDEEKRARKPLHVMAYGVHVFTALGAAIGFLAMKAALTGQFTECFWWLALAFAVDAADGPMARYLNVRETASRYDGSVLDLVVDFITYVFVPAAILIHPKVMGETWGLVAGLIITVGSALYFSDTTMKTDDLWFKGFPAVWNVVVFYFVIFTPPVWLSFSISIVLTILMFLPVAFVHPIRVQRWRSWSLAMLAIWSCAGVAALWYNLTPPTWVHAVLLGCAVYFVGLSFMRDLVEVAPDHADSRN
jgi:phosphatidylcholine synthase